MRSEPIYIHIYIYKYYSMYLEVSVGTMAYRCCVALACLDISVRHVVRSFSLCSSRAFAFFVPDTVEGGQNSKSLTTRRGFFYFLCFGR